MFQVYGMLLARELPQVNVPDQYLPLDLNAARINIEKAAYHGFAKAQVKMGAAYELCQLGCDFNPALSLHYNNLAARQGEPEAEMAISKWFLCGHEGLFEKNDELAFKYAQRAAQSGLPTAEFALGYFYEIGIYVDVDLQEAKSWYAKAAANGNKDATSRIESISRSKTLSRKDHERVAIARIKSQYRSHARNSSIYSQAPAPIQENLEMPDPSKMRISDDDPMAQRPGSGGAPYPDGPARPRTSSQQNYSSSAFGINPNIRPAPSNYGGAPPPNHGGYRPPNSPRHSPAAPPGDMNSPTGAPKLDIGYSAPSSPDRRGRPPPDRRAPASQQGGPTQGLPQSPRPSGAPSAGPYPPRVDSKPPSRGSATSTPKPSGPPANNPPQKPETPPAKPQGKGPKTFEEMGVPIVKQESECVSFWCPLSLAVQKLTCYQVVM